MRIFISYASESRTLAEALAIELRPLGHRVFLDKHDLAPGETYTDQIRESIRRSNLFVFLITPEAVTPGRYTLTELQVLQELAPSPGHRVLPVMAAPTPIKDVPDYLAGLTILMPTGDVLTETVNAIANLEVRAARLRLLRAVAASAVVLGLIGLAALASVFVSRTPTFSTLRDPFSVYGTNQITWGETAVVRLTNRRPDLLPDFSCRVDASALADNLLAMDHDKHCETITLKLKQEPFIEPKGTVAIDVAAQNGEIVWRGSWQVGLGNFIDERRFSMRQNEPNRADGGELEILLDGKPLGAGFGCRVVSGSIVRRGTSDGPCLLGRTGSRPTVGMVSVRHDKSGWSQDYTIEPVY